MLKGLVTQDSNTMYDFDESVVGIWVIEINFG